ncbi:MAG: hypothetical protein R3Y12_06785 [Clostridia bacterium]
MNRNSRAPGTIYPEDLPIHFFTISIFGVVFYNAFNKNLRLTLIMMLIYFIQIITLCFVRKVNLNQIADGFEKFNTTKAVIEEYSLNSIKGYYILLEFAVNIYIFFKFLPYAESIFAKFLVLAWQGSIIFTNTMSIIGIFLMYAVCRYEERKGKMWTPFEVAVHMLSPFFLAKKKCHILLLLKIDIPKEFKKEQRKQYREFFEESLTAIDSAINKPCIGAISKNEYIVYYSTNCLFGYALKSHLEHLQEHNTPEYAVEKLTVFDDDFLKDRVDDVVVPYKYSAIDLDWEFVPPMTRLILLLLVKIKLMTKPTKRGAI